MIREGNFGNAAANEKRPEDYAQMNYYERLGVERNVTTDQIKDTFRKFVLEYHPDIGGNTKAFQYVSEAYTELTDEKKRADYDLKLQHQEATPLPPQVKPRPVVRNVRPPAATDPRADIQTELNSMIGDIFKDF